MKNVLLIGSSGFLGRDIGHRISITEEVIFTHCHHPHFPTSVKYDFFNDNILEVIDNREISLVIFAAHVEGKGEEEVETSMKHFVQACGECRLVYLSSDGIFDGAKGSYSEQEIPTPCTPYGRNLLLCESLIQEYSSNYCIIRPSYIYDFSGSQLDSRLARTKETLLKGTPVELFDDMYKSPLGVGQVAEAIIKLALSSYIGVVHVGGERLTIYGFHQQAMKAMGIDTEHLHPCPMPEKAGYLRDTSLETSLWQRLTGMKPLSIKETLSPDGRS